LSHSNTGRADPVARLDYLPEAEAAHVVALMSHQLDFLWNKSSGFVRPNGGKFSFILHQPGDTWGMRIVSANASSPRARGRFLPAWKSRRLPAATSPAVTILLCTLNGGRFLTQQLASLEGQTFKNWKLIASDDGSRDRTKSILLAFQKSCQPGKVEIIDGPRRGATANFLFQACAENLVSQYYAFCDQDDVWDADKLARAIDALPSGGSAALQSTFQNSFQPAFAPAVRVSVGMPRAFSPPPDRSPPAPSRAHSAQRPLPALRSQVSMSSA
jgi:hypothetical protein